MDIFEKLPFSSASLEFPTRSVALHSMLGSCGHEEKTTSDYRWNGLGRGPMEFGIWQYTIAGRGELEHEGKVMQVLPGQAMMLHIPHDHCYRLPPDSDRWEFIFINLRGGEVMRLWREAADLGGPVADFAPESETVLTATEIFHKALEGVIKTPQQASAMAYRFVMSAIDDVLPGSAADNKPPHFAEEVTEFGIRHLHEAIGVSDLAEAAGFSRFHFSRVFKAWYGEGPSRFLHDLRMKRAVRLLQTERAAIKDIAYQCGFSDSSYFCKVFRKEYGISPEKFRR